MIWLYIALGVFLIIIILMVRHPIIAKIAFRNFIKKRQQVIVATCGLMVGGAIISSSLVIQDTMNYIFVRDVGERLDLIDETVTIPSGTQGGNAPFPYRFYTSLKENLSEELIDGISPALITEASVKIVEKNQSRSSIQIIGINFSIDSVFGPFVVNGKEKYFEDLKDDEIILNQRASEYLGAGSGDTLILFGKKELTFHVREVVENSGKANYLSGKNAFITLDAAQNLTEQEGMINLLKISNKGGVIDGAGYSDRVEMMIKEALSNATTMEDIGIYTYSEDNYQRTLIVFSMRLFDNEMLTTMISHPNITSMIDAYATYLYFPYIPGYFEFIRVRGKNGTLLPVPLTCIDFRNDAFGQYTTIEGRARFTSDLKVINGSYEVYLTNTTSTSTGLKKGDVTTLAIRSGTTDVTISLIVKDVVLDHPGSGNGAFPPVFGGGIYLNRDALPELNSSNIVRYLAKNGKELELAVKKVISTKITYASMGFNVNKVKQKGLDDAKDASKQIGEIFLVLGTFSIFSGMILVVNIFLMLAEERKHEMGISRALGMNRLHLVEAFTFEGLLYAVLASAAGVLMGILIACVMISSFGIIFTAENIVMIPVVRIESLVYAFSIASLLTLGTVIVTGIRISRMNIVCAIRNLPEKILFSDDKKIRVLGLIGMICGASGTAYSLYAADAVLIAIAPCITVLGISMLVSGSTTRAGYILSGVFMIVWVVGPFATTVMDLVGATENVHLLIGAGMLLISGGILIVMFSSKEIIAAVTSILSRKRNIQAIVRIGLAYPMKKKVRTANILTMFSIVIFTITTISMISALEEDAVKTSIHRLSGGYDLVVSFEHDRAPPDFKETLPQRVSAMKWRDASGVSEVTTKLTIKNKMMVYPLRGVDHTFIKTNQYTFCETLPEFDTPSQIWDAVEQNLSLAVVDGTFAEGQGILQFVGSPVRIHPGDIVILTTAMGQEVKLTVAGVMDELFFPGIFVSSKFLVSSFPDAKVTTYFLHVDGSPSDAARLIETAYALEGAKTLVVNELVDEFLRIVRSIMLLVQAFVGIGLIVGIAGLGIVTAREVVERKREIGTLKALGFTDTMVFKSFLIQVLFITLLGSCLGVSLGIALSWKLYERYFTQLAPFSIPWADLTLIVLITAVATILTTASSAYRASKMPPAEVLRHIE